MLLSRALNAPPRGVQCMILRFNRGVSATSKSTFGSAPGPSRQKHVPIGSGYTENITGKSGTGFSVRDSDVYQNSMQQWHVRRRYTGRLKAVILDWAGTVLDCGVLAPAKAYMQTFEEMGLPITMPEARGPMGAHKKVHIRRITQMTSVRERWKSHFGRYPTEEDVDKLYERFMPLQLKTLPIYSKMISGAVDTVRELQVNRGLKIGTTTGFTTQIIDILKVSAAEAGYKPDAYVASDQVPAARPYPFMVWLNAIQLEVSPISAIVKVDDTADGVIEGITAGTWSVGLARTGNYMGMNEDELDDLEANDPEQYTRMISAAYDQLINAGAHYVVDDITGLPRIIDDINRRLAQGEVP